VRLGFGARLLRPRIKFERGLQAPPLTANHQMVDGAFGYLLRFYLQRINPQARVPAWPAEAGTELIGVAQEGAERKDIPTISPYPRRLRAAAYVADAKRRYQAYVQNGPVTEELLVAAYRLAHLDVALRSGPDRVDWRSINYLRSDDAADLRALLDLVDERTFRAARLCILSPSLAASELVGGADPDFILDYCVVDVNTAYKPRLDIRDIYRLVGYYLLLGLDGIARENGKTEQCPVNSIGIYFARFGHLWKAPIREIVPADAVPELTRWFVKTACASHQGASELLSEFGGPLAVHFSEHDGAAVNQKER
jgi:hypothetical protein